MLPSGVIGITVLHSPLMWTLQEKSWELVLDLISFYVVLSAFNRSNQKSYLELVNHVSDHTACELYKCEPHKGSTESQALHAGMRVSVPRVHGGAE